ncbi:unnamed protein product [Ectocarpus sp. CCAP 1310/34]|nr:unnamed protein product [Ectocarpus sp. CCAP 1310/34]
MHHCRGQAISWLGDTSQFGVSRVMDICRASSTTLDVDAGPTPNRVSFQNIYGVPNANNHVGSTTLSDSSVATDIFNPRERCDTLTHIVFNVSLHFFRWSQRVFLPLIDLATSTEFKNSPLRTEGRLLSNSPSPPVLHSTTWWGRTYISTCPPKTNVLFSTLYKLDQADGLWPRVFDELSKHHVSSFTFVRFTLATTGGGVAPDSHGKYIKLTTRGSVRDTSYTAFHRDRDKQISGLWEPSTWVDVVLPIARYAGLVARVVNDFSTSTDMFMVEVTKRFRDAVLLDTAFQKAATETLPNLIAAWKVNCVCIPAIFGVGCAEAVWDLSWQVGPSRRRDKFQTAAGVVSNTLATPFLDLRARDQGGGRWEVVMKINTFFVVQRAAVQPLN